MVQKGTLHLLTTETLPEEAVARSNMLQQLSETPDQLAELPISRAAFTSWMESLSWVTSLAAADSTQHMSVPDAAANMKVRVCVHPRALCVCANRRVLHSLDPFEALCAVRIAYLAMYQRGAREGVVWFVLCAIHSSKVMCEARRAMQTADFLGDSKTVAAEAKTLGKMCDIADWTTDAGKDVLTALLSLSDNLLREALQACTMFRSVQACFEHLPFSLHRALLAAQTEHIDGEVHLHLAVPQISRHVNPATCVRSTRFSAAACMAFSAQLLLLRGLASVDLSGCLREGEHFEAAVHALSCSTQLWRLRLARCVPGRTGLQTLAEAMQRWRLRELDLEAMMLRSASRTADKQPHINAIACALGGQTMLTNLSLRGLRETEQVVAAVGQLTGLQRLDIASRLKPPDISLGTLQQLQQLTYVDISRCAKRIDAALFVACTGLRVLAARGKLANIAKLRCSHSWSASSSEAHASRRTWLKWASLWHSFES